MKSKMNQTGIVIMIAFLFMTAVSCGHSGDNIAKIVEERDSLKYEMKKNQRAMANIDTLVAVLNNGLDSIAAQEGALFVFNQNEGAPSKETILKKVGVLKEIIDTQREKINNLESQLARQKAEEGEDAVSGVSGLLAHVKAQLAKKDLEIKQLKEQLEKKDVDIANLQRQVGAQSVQIAELNRRATIQNEALKRQDEMLNQCYMVVAPKKVLEQKGIIKKGRIVPSAALDRSKFVKVDIRKFTQLTFEAKKALILSSMPQSSYTLTTNGKGSFTLEITNPNAFWSVSNYLVIQTN